MYLWKAVDIAMKQCMHLLIIIKRSDYVYMETYFKKSINIGYLIATYYFSVKDYFILVKRATLRKTIRTIGVDKFKDTWL